MTSPSAAPISETPYGHRARIGYTSPPLTTEVFPYEFYRMVPAGVTLVITTLAIVVRSKAEVDQSYDTSMKAAREMAAAGVDIIVLGGVPINLSRGTANAQQMVEDLEAELKVKVSTSASQAQAQRALGWLRRRWRSPTPILTPIASPAMGSISGYEVLGAYRLEQKASTRSAASATSPRSSWGKAGRMRIDADTILLPSPQWPTAGAIEPLEREFGVNVMSAQQAIVWDALRRCGVNDKIEGYGRFFRD